MFDEGALARHIAFVHAADLRDRDMGFVDDEEEVLGEVVEQTVRCRTGIATVDVPGVVLDPGREAHRLHHLEVIGRAHLQPLRFEQLVLRFELAQALLQLVLDPADGRRHPVLTCDIMAGREHVDGVLVADDLTRQRVEGLQRFDLVAEEFDAQSELLVLRDDLHGVSADPEGAAGEGHVIAGVLHGHEAFEQFVPVAFVSLVEGDHPVDVLLRSAETVDARHRRDHDYITPGQQRVRGRVAQPFDFVVDRGVLLDERVRLRHIGFRLVVVVVGDEVLDSIVGQQLSEFVGQLCGQGLVRRHDQRRSLHLFDEPCRRRRLARAGGTEEDDVALPRVEAFGDLLDRRRLVTGGRVLGDDLEGRHFAGDVGAVADRWQGAF